MLTRQELALIRAALRYLADELLPHGRDALTDYLDEPSDKQHAWTAEEVTSLCDRLRRGRLCWARCTPNATRLLDRELLPSSEITSAEHDSLTLLATVLVPDKE